MKKLHKLLLLLVLCLYLTAVFCGCGNGKAQAETTAAAEIQETQVATEASTSEPTEPEPVYELQTVYLCVQETVSNYEGGSSRKGYTYDEYGRMIECFQILPDGSRGWVTEYSYDENGNLVQTRHGDSISIMTYDEAGRLLSELSYYKDKIGNEYYYVYDEMGFVIEETRITRYEEEITYSYTMTYNEDHTEVQIDQFKNGEPNGQTLETYNAAGQVLTSAVYDVNGNWKRTQTWTYDEDGKLLQEGKYSRSETQADYLTIYTYDENGLLLSKNVDYYYGSMTEYTYEEFEILVRVN